MTTVNDQFERSANLQQQLLEPVRAFSGAAEQAFQRVARRNCEILGDYVKRFDDAGGEDITRHVLMHIIADQ